jgi:hypothetical protein
MKQRRLARAGEALPAATEVDAAIEACGGDARAAVAALLADVDILKSELELFRVAVSSGFSRGWHHRKRRRLAELQSETIRREAILEDGK